FPQLRDFACEGPQPATTTTYRGHVRPPRVCLRAGTQWLGGSTAARHPGTTSACCTPTPVQSKRLRCDCTVRGGFSAAFLREARARCERHRGESGERVPSYCARC